MNLLFKSLVSIFSLSSNRAKENNMPRVKKYIAIDLKNPFPLKVSDKDAKGGEFVARLQRALGLKDDGKFGYKTQAVVSDKLGSNEVSEDAFKSLELKYLNSISNRGEELEYLVIHCTATPDNTEILPEDIFNWHLGKRKLSNGKYKYRGKVYDYVHHIPLEFFGSISSTDSNGRGWSQVGYSDMILLDGSVHNLVPYDNDNIVDVWEVTNGAKGYNRKARHVVYVGGTNKFGEPMDTRNTLQSKSLESYVKKTIEAHPKIKVLGHNQISSKACPSFDVRLWLKSIGVEELNVF